MSEPKEARRSGFLIAVFGVGVIVSSLAVLETMRFAFPLSWYFGAGFLALALGMGVSLVLVAAAFVGELRAPVRAESFPRRIVFYVFLLHFVFVHASLQPYRPLFFDPSVTIAFGLLALLRLRGPAVARLFPTKVLRGLDLVLMNVGVLLFATELTLRGVAVAMPSPILSQGTERAEQRIDRYRYEPGLLRYGFPVNESGYYDEAVTAKAEGETLVASLGDSFAAGVVPHYHHFTTVAERELPGVRVHNLGVPAIGAPEYLYLLRYEALPLEPDLVVVNLFIGNDLKPKSVQASDHRWLRSWYERRNLLTFLVPKRLAAVAREQAAMREGGNTDGALQGESGVEAAKLTPEAIAEAFPWVVDPSLERPFLSDEGLWRNELKAIGEGWLEAEESIPSLLAYLAEMIEAAEDVPVAFVLIPALCQVDDALWERVLRRYPDLEERRDDPQERIAAWCAEQGVPCLDLLPALRAEPPLADGESHLYHRNDTHFNTRGNRVAGEAVARFLDAILARESRNE